MKLKVICLYTSLFLLFSVIVHAQKTPLPTSIGAKVLVSNYGYPNMIDSLRFTNGLEVFVSQYITPRLTATLPLKIGVHHLPEEVNNMNFVSFDGQLQFHLADYDAKVTPYIFAGGGITIENFDSSNVQIPAGIGFNFRLAPNSFLNLQAEYRYGLTKDLRNNAQVGIGYTYRLGKTKTDSDGDGVPDSEDQCPEEIGTKDLAGCPDKDGDGVTDIADACPTIPGAKELLGCPDSDGDGIPDNNDKCPDDFGTNATAGCPDKDGDGVADAEDECPDRAGARELAGCPDEGIEEDDMEEKDMMDTKEKNTTEDEGKDMMEEKDGIDDNMEDENTMEDEVKEEEDIVEEKDTDLDGILDVEDQCPREFGVASANGCPDQDGDGLRDSDDRCPDRYGNAANNGCPEIVRRDEIEIAESDRAILDDAAQSLQFETASAVLKSTSYDILKQVVAVLQRYPDATLTIEGHTDDIGRTATNQLLSEHRAKACYEFLVAQGVDSERISYVGYGEIRPIESNRTREGRALNRRVEFKLFQ